MALRQVSLACGTIGKPYTESSSSNLAHFSQPAGRIQFRLKYRSRPTIERLLKLPTSHQTFAKGQGNRGGLGQPGIGFQVFGFRRLFQPSRMVWLERRANLTA